MIRLLHKVPSSIIFACSGGPDSMAALDFLCNSKRNVQVCHFNHGTEFSRSFEDTVREFCVHRNLELHIGNISRDKHKRESLEEYWRNERLDFFFSFSKPVVTAHNLDDVCEWWIFTSLHGNPRLIPARNKNILRPFLLTKKSDLQKYCNSRNLKFETDPSNSEDRYMRSFIRNNMMDDCLKVNPGLYKVMSKKLISETSG